MKTRHLQEVPAQSEKLYNLTKNMGLMIEDIEKLMNYHSKIN